MGYETEGIYKSLRSTLDELGYHQALSFDSLYLVKALVGDLIKTTQSLKHYKELSQKTLETCSELEVGIEPYKQDNARLIQECNHLNKKLIAQKDQHTDVQKDFKLKLRQLESVKDELEFTNRETSARLADLERDCLKKNERILELQNVLLKRHPQRPSVCRSKDRGDSVTFESKLKSSLSLDSTAQLLKEADVKTKALRNEVNDLKRKLDDKGYIIDSLQTKVSTRDIEIHRLSSLLEGGRPVGVVIQDHPIPMSFCTCKKKPDSKVNLELERKLKECLRRQHDAMLHALRLSEKNKRLQSRLETLDDKKNHKGNISELHDKITSLTQLIETLKKENQSYVKSVKSKTSMVSQQKETSQLKEKVEDFKIMEKDLMKEIDRLEKENLLQKTHIADLESKLLACLTAKEELGRTNKQNDHPSKANDGSKKSEMKGAEVLSTTCNTDHGYESLMKERDHYQKEYAFIVDKLVSIPLKFHNSSRESPLSNLSNLILERDQYYRECEQQRINNDSRSDAVHCELKRRLSDQGREISDLKHKYRLLEEEEYVKRQTGSDKATEMRGTGTGIDLDSYLSLQDEKDKLYVSNCKLQQENTELLSRLKKVQTESCSMQEDRIQSLETERRHLLSKQSDLTSRLVDLEEENRGLKKKLYVFENELSEERNALQSIRRVQEQTDQALLSFRKTHDSLECQIRDLKDDNARLQVERDNLACQLQSLRDDNHRMRTGLVQLDQQKDSILMALDSKIDLISRLERDVSSKDSKIELLEDRIAKLKSALDETLNLNKRSEREAKLATTEIDRFKYELNNLELERNRAQSEVRRLQTELYDMNQHNMTIQQELEASRTEAEDVKLQLQHYCCEVQRIEEILSKKESERLDLLKHLKFISQETAELENNNHSLDGEMKSCKNLLAESEKKVMKLEALVQDKDCSIKSLEAKLEELSHVTAQLESQVQCCQEEKYRLGEELAGCQETLDTMLRQKEELRLQLADTENYKTKEAGKGEE